MKVKIEKLVFGGNGMGRMENKIAFILGALPGEEVEFDVVKDKKNLIEGIATKIISPSPDRIEPKDDHYLSCSPWQVLTYEKENEWKKIIAEETYSRIGNFKDLNLEIVAPENPYEYRNKIEYNFIMNGVLSYAFHYRGTHNLRPVDKCILADKFVQKAGDELIAELRKGEVPKSVLKSAIIRSNSKDSASVALFVKERDYLKRFYVPNLGSMKGLQIYYSHPLSPASVPTELLFSTGQPEMEYEINSVNLRSGLLSFFQINPGIFEKALLDIKKHINGEKLIDYYSGVGAISLALHGSYKEAVLIENNAEATDFALKNVNQNNFTNITLTNDLAENTFAEIGKGDVVILDPPRTGLHKDVIRHLLKSEPKKIIYLSCGIDTHARDISVLLEKYNPVFWKLYNFFPRTPHIEGLCVLEKK